MAARSSTNASGSSSAWPRPRPRLRPPPQPPPPRATASRRPIRRGPPPPRPRPHLPPPDLGRTSPGPFDQRRASPYDRRDFRSRDRPLGLHARHVPRHGGDPPRVAAAAHAADVAHQRDLGDRRGRRDPGHWRQGRHPLQPGARLHRGGRVHHQHRQRLPDHRPHAQDVPPARRGEEVSPQLLTLIYIVTAAFFILSLKWLSSPATARRGVRIGELGMLLAVIGTLLRHEVVDYQWILVALFVGSAIGVPLAYLMPMTAVPQRTALSHACGALAAALVGTAEYYREAPHGFPMVALALEVLLGSLTFTGSLMAAGKLQEILPQRPITYRNQNLVNLSLLGVAIACGVVLVLRPETTWLFPVFILLSLALDRKST